MKTDNSILVEYFREYIKLSPPLQKDDCPSSESLASSFIPSTSLRERKRIVDHISYCKSCRDLFMILLQIQKSETCSELSQNGRERKGCANKTFSKLVHISPLLRFSCVFAGLVLLVTSALLIIKNYEISRIYRSRGAGINLVYPITVHPKSEKLIFQWKQQLESGYYVLELFDEALLPLWTSQKADELQIQLPDDIFSSLKIGKSYFWMVTGFSEDLKIDESPLTKFILVNRP
jgi:hypothetical protein